MILIVVNGGPNTFETVYNAMDKAIPILVLKESKGCADLIANAINANLDPDRPYAEFAYSRPYNVLIIYVLLL